MIVKYYTDGSCRQNGNENAVGAWGFIGVSDKDVSFVAKAGLEEHSTNQRCELLAILNACQHAEEMFGDSSDIWIMSDSAYAINCVNDKWYDKWLMNGWRTSTKKDVVNRDLWEQLIPYFRKANFLYKKVKGHNGVHWNEEVDEIVQKMTLSAMR